MPSGRLSGLKPKAEMKKTWPIPNAAMPCRNNSFQTSSPSPIHEKISPIRMRLENAYLLTLKTQKKDNQIRWTLDRHWVTYCAIAPRDHVHMRQKRKARGQQSKLFKVSESHKFQNFSFSPPTFPQSGKKTWGKSWFFNIFFLASSSWEFKTK